MDDKFKLEIVYGPPPAGVESLSGGDVDEAISLVE